MSWRNPRYCYLHAARDAGAAAISASHAIDTDHPKDYLIDDRAGSLFKFDASGTGRYIDVNRGAAGLDAIDRLLIPSGHNLAGATIDLDADDNASFTSATSLLSGESVAAGLIDEIFSSNQEQYLRLTINGSGQWEIPELIYTFTEETTRGPEQGWVDYLRHNTLDFEKESGAIASLALGSDRRFIEYVYRDVVLPADLTVFSELIAECGTSKPFFLDPCFTTETALWMKLTQDSRQVQDPAVPAATDATQRRIELSMLEHLA